VVRVPPMSLMLWPIMTYVKAHGLRPVGTWHKGLTL
jgi:hypothetical protein